ncbi:MAG TPA: homoprotocatechuate degradation operon regulator HpaR [Steroidobacteraceae bacterium]|nr:homoprotocatechuate degradation operon regulator HpaR [Steroidobacteraceae bacterium]
MSPKQPRNGGGQSESPRTANGGAARDRGTLASRDLPMRAFSKSLPMELLKAREAVMRRFRPALRVHGVTEQQWRILRALAHAGPLEVSELAEATCLLPPSLSRILPDMERRQLVGRRQADSDLRRSVISLERKGLRLIAMHAPTAERIYDEIARQFGPAKLAQLFALLHELEQTLSTHDDAPSTDTRSRTRSRAPAARRAR